MDKIDFTVDCRMYQFKEETFRVYYIKHEGKWLPMPVNFCDNGCNSDMCQQCVADVMAKALQTDPAFPK